MDWLEIRHSFSVCLFDLILYIPVNNLSVITTGRPQSKALLTISAGQKSLETVFSMTICCQSGHKWQLKTLFLAIFDLRSSIVLMF